MSGTPEDVTRRAGVALAEGDLAGAIEVLAAARRFGVDSASIASDLGALLFRQGREDESIPHLLAALAMADAAPHHFTNLGYCLKRLGRHAEALAVFDQGLVRFADSARLHWQRGLLRLALGQFAQGLDDYEWRWRVEDFPSKRRDFAQPPWDGRPHPQSVLLVHAEQGFGDTLQFLRFVAPAARCFRETILEVQPELAGLVAYQHTAGTAVLPNTVTVRPTGPAHPEAGWQVPLLSLPRRLGLTDFAAPPCGSAYLAAPRALRMQRDAMGRPRLAVCIVWAGRPSHPHDAERSFELADCAPLWAVPDVQWFALQKGPRVGEVAQWGAPITDLSSHLTDFFATAQLIRGLDLVIAPDTAVAHLAAALGVPTWLGVQRTADWRWGIEGEATPWYEAMRLFRQQGRTGWGPVFARMAEILRGESPLADG